jgi:hypothetical protein
MNTKEVKDIRKQLRNVAQEMAPAILSSEVGTQMYKQLMQAVEGKLKSLEVQIQDTLTKIDERSKDLQAYAMRQIAAMMPIQPSQPTESQNETKQT